MSKVLSKEEAKKVKPTIKKDEPLPYEGRSFKFHAEFSIKSLEKANDDGNRLIEGYASTNDLDRQGDIVEPEAFRTAIAEFMTNPILFYMHEWRNLPIGKINAANIDKTGFWVKAQITKSNDTANKVWSLIQEGVLKTFSIGFDILDGAWEVVDGDEIFRITKLRLYEVSVVNIPANRHATFSVAKALQMGDDLKCNEPCETQPCSKCTDLGHDEVDEELDDLSVKVDDLRLSLKLSIDSNDLLKAENARLEGEIIKANKNSMLALDKRVDRLVEEVADKYSATD